MRSYTYIILFLACSFLHGQENFFPILGGQRAGTSTFPFLKIGVSARASAMAECVAAIEQDASSLFYNPAAISQLKGQNVFLSRIEWPADIHYDFFAATTSLGRSHFIGISGGILHMAPMPERTEYLPHGTGNYFIYQDRFLSITYSARMTDRFSFGISTKVVSENLAGREMEVVMIDMGTFYWTGFRSLRFSAVLSHFGPQSKPSGSYEKSVLDKDTGEEVTVLTDFKKFSPPTIFKVGIAYDWFTNKVHNFTTAFQLNHPVDDAENISVGCEYTFLNSLALRAGYKFNRREEDASIGVGLQIPFVGNRFHIDYAYSTFKHLSNPQRLSIGVNF